MDKKGQKRKDYLSWDEYFMGVAMLSGMRSKDPHSQVGACIVSEDNKILSMGYNDTPSVIASKKMLDAAGVRYYKYNRTDREITIRV